MVPSLNEFTFLCCPECVFRSKIATSFQTHAIQNHPKSSVLFSAVKEEPPDFTDISISFDDETKGKLFALVVNILVELSINNLFILS